MDTVTELGQPITIGTATHYEVAVINDRTWKRGDVFYVRDIHGVPRPISFQYIINGTIVCYSKQRYRVPGGWQPVGFTDRFTPAHSAVDMDPTELEFQQLAADLIDIGRDDEASQLLDVLAETGDTDELDAARKRAQQLLDQDEDMS